MRDPGRYSKRKLDFASALKLYYKVAFLPFIAYLLVGVAAVTLGINVHGFGMNSMFGSLQQAVKAVSYGTVIIGGILLFS